jgi:hypothetical protein
MSENEQANVMIPAKPTDADTAIEVARPLSRAAEAQRAIQEYTDYEADWDLEGADPIDPEAAALAASLVERVDLQACERAIAWQVPVVGPDPEGGIDLVWEAGGRRALLMTRPGFPDEFVCVINEAGRRAHRRAATLDEAVEHALWALEGG